LGKSVVEYGEARSWDELTVGDVVTAGIEAAVTTYTVIADVLTGKVTPSEVAKRAKVATEKKIEDVKSSTAIKRDSAKVEQINQQTKTQSSKEAKGVKVAEKVDATAKDVAHQTRYELDDLVRRAEAAIIGKSFDPSSAAAEDATSKDSTPPTPEVLSPSPREYDLPLPLGFEPPPGYVRPFPPKHTPEEKSKSLEPQRELPLVFPALSNVSEPIITHLAGTIDSLASFLKSDPKAAEKAGDIIETAQGDLASLVDRIETLKEQERTALDAKLDEQTRECTLRLLEMEMEAQDKLDAQEEGFRQAFEQERAKFIQAYREKLDHELKVQTELINER
jgi:mitofilin